MTSNYEDFKPLKVGEKVKVKVETSADTWDKIINQKNDMEVTIDKYKIVYNEAGDCCNWSEALIKRKKIMSLWDKKTFDIGYVKEIKLDFGKDIVQRVGKKTGKVWESKVDGKIIRIPETYWGYKIIEKKDLPEDWRKNRDLTDNVFTLTLNKDTKLYFLNGNNEDGYYSWDFMIYRMGEEDKLLFKSSL